MSISYTKNKSNKHPNFSDPAALNADIQDAGTKLKTITGSMTKTIIVGITLSREDMKGYGLKSSQTEEIISKEDGDIEDIINKITGSIG